MRKALISLLSIFIFIFLSIPALATFDWEIDETASFGTNWYVLGLDCINATDNNVYCYLWTGSLTGHSTITKYNATWSSLGYCTFNAPSSSPVGFVVINETTAVNGESNGANIWNITTLTTAACVQLNSSGGLSSPDWSYIYSANYQGPYWYRGTQTGDKVYITKSITDLGLGLLNDTPFWSDVQSLSYPSKTTNNTFYASSSPSSCTSPGNIKKYTDGVLQETYEPLTYYYDIPDTNGISWDIIEVDGVETIFIADADTTTCDGGETDHLYRAAWNLVSDCGGYDDGAWCTEYNLTLSCTFTNDIQPCYDVYTEQPNPFNATQRTFKVYNSSAMNCVQELLECPADYMCVQYLNPVTHQYEGKVECYNGQTGDAYYYNETGDSFDGTSYTAGLTENACEFPSLYTNSWTCQVNYCKWCSLPQQCTYPLTDCDSLMTSANCTNTTTTCYDQYCNYVDCAGTGTSNLRNWLNQSMHSEFGSDIIALIVSSFVAIMAFMNIDKDSKNPTILFGTFMLAASVCSFVGLLTAWFLVLEGALIFVLIFWKVRGG